MPESVSAPGDGESPRMPPGFWARPDMVRALAAWDVPAMLAAILGERRWTQLKLAGVLGFSQSWVSYVLHRQQALTMDQGREIARLFGAPVQSLAGPGSGRADRTGSEGARAESERGEAALG